MRFEILNFKDVTSTNDVAINLIKEKKREIGFVYAETQSQGRGTHGKTWVSEKGNLFCTIFFSMKKNYPPFNEFSIINPVIISNIIKYFCERQKVSVKWPNDIYVNRKKICGILQELITLEDKKFLIIGIGVNIISNPKVNNNYEATNIFLETKKTPSIKDIIKKILSSYENFFMNLNSYSYVSFKKKAESLSLK